MGGDRRCRLELQRPATAVLPRASTHPAAARRPPRPRQSTTGSKQCSKKPPSPSYTCRWEEKHTTQQISKIIRSENNHTVYRWKKHIESHNSYIQYQNIRYQKSLSPTRIKQKNRIKPNRLLAHSSTHKTRQTMTDTNAFHVLLPHCGFGCCVHAMKYSICVFDECVF